MTNEEPNAYGTQSTGADAHIGPEAKLVRPYGTDLAHASAGALGQNPSPYGTDLGNGFASRRAHTHVGPSSHPNRSETQPDGSHGANPVRVNAHVGPTLNGNTDTRGLVSDEERARLQPFGTDVRTLRKAVGLSQEQLGKLAGIGTTHISRLEQGRRRPSVDAIKALARILAPAGTSDAVEQRWGKLAGDSLREGTARRKRRVDNKQRREAAAELTKLQAKMGRIVANKERQGLQVSDSLRSLARLDLTARIRPVDDEPGITGIEPLRSTRDAREEVQDLIRSMTRRRR